MNTANTSPDKVTQDQLDDAIRKHRYFSIGKPGGARAVMKFKDLSGLSFRSADLSGADFTGSDLSGCNLAKGTFNGTAFYGCNMQNANLTNAEFKRSDMRGVSLENAVTEGADMATADLREGKVLSTKHPAATAEQAAKPTAVSEDAPDTDSKTAQPRESFIDLSVVPEKAREAAVSLDHVEEPVEERRSFTDLSAEPEETRKAAVSLDQVEEPADDRIPFTDLSVVPDALMARLINHAKWIQSGGKSGEQLDISDVDMRAIHDLARYPLIAARVQGADFSGMNLSGIQMQSACLKDCNFTGTDLTDADLRGSNLSRANLTNAILENTNLGPLIFGDRQQPVDLSDAILDGTSLEKTGKSD